MLERILPFWQFGTPFFWHPKTETSVIVKGGPYIPRIISVSFPWHSCVRVRKTSAFVPGGDNGVLLKFNSPTRRAYADNFGFLRDDCSKLMLISACCSIFHQSCIGKSLLTMHSPETKWFLNFWMLLSAALTQCSCGSTNCRVALFSFSMNVFITFEQSLSMTWSFGLNLF